MHHKGFTLVEVVVALLLLSITAGMMGGAFMTGGRVSASNEERIIAVGLARELIEKAKAVPFGEPITPGALPPGFEKFSRSVKTEFVKEDNFNEKNPVATDFIRVTATVSAPDIQDVVLTTVINKNMSHE